jgi:hypothetical protein
MEYEKEIDLILEDIFREFWMDDSDFKEIVDEITSNPGISKQEMSDALKVGISNGFTIEEQTAIIKKSVLGFKKY